MKRSTVVWIVVSAVTGTLLLAGSIAGIIYLMISRTKSGRPTEADKRLLVTKADLTRMGVEDLDPRYEKCSMTRLFDGSREISCYYAEGREADGKPRLYLVSSVHLHTTSLDARQAFHVSVAAMKGGVALWDGDARLEPAPSLVTLGDQNYAAFVMSKQKAGNAFVLRKGKVVHRVLMTGWFFDEPADVRKLFEPVLQESERQTSPAKP